MAPHRILSVGIAARNEQATVAQALRSVEVALAGLPGLVPAEVIVALNGCTDGTPGVVERYVAGYRGPTAYRLIWSRPGLVEAQRAIARAARSRDYLILVDADCVLHPGCLRELVRAMRERPAVRAAWASMVPADRDARPGFWRRVYNFADYHPEVVRRGRHLCGRAFAIRDYEVPLASAQRAPVHRRVAAYLNLTGGPVSDDSYLSRRLVGRYGPGSIHHAREAVVYFQPIRHLRGFYRAQRRKAYEMRRLDLLFPEYRTVHRGHFGRRVDPVGYRRLGPVGRLQCALYRCLYTGLRRLARLGLETGIALVRLGVPLRPCTVWRVVEETKRPFTAGGSSAPPAAR